MRTKMESRGIRNCNPGNIRLSKDKWKGLREKQEDKSFFQFIEMKWGYRALLRTLQTYNRKHGCKTIAEIISRWAPDNENNTSSYINNVCRDLGVPASFIPDVGDKTTMCALAASISRIENGVKANMQDVEAGWELL